MPSTNSVAQIAPGASLSGPITIGDALAMFIFFPAQWSGGNVTFQCSIGGPWADLFDEHGKEVTIPFVENAIVPINVQLVPKGCQIKVRAGTRDYPRVQSEGRDFTITVVT